MSGASPWSIKGISKADRDRAKQAARESGETIGAWLARRIRESASTGAPSDGGALTAGGSDVAREGRTSSLSPAAPVEPPPGEERRMMVRGLGRRASDVPDFDFGPGQWQHARDTLQAREEARAGEGLAALRDRVRRLENSLESQDREAGRLADQVTALVARFEAVERRLSETPPQGKLTGGKADLGRFDELARQLARDIRIALNPIEQELGRLADRLQLVEVQVHQKPKPRRGLSRLFGRR